MVSTNVTTDNFYVILYFPKKEEIDTEVKLPKTSTPRKKIYSLKSRGEGIKHNQL